MIPNLDTGHARLILEVADNEKCYLEEKAYILATTDWETNGTFLPVEEAYFLGEPRATNYRKTLSYYPWYGRGFVQITHERNYKVLGKRLGIDLTTDPAKVMEPDISARILVIGSREGLFTGRRLSTYLKPGSPDYYSARRVINGLDSAKKIADLAVAYEQLLSPAPGYHNVRRGSRGAEVTRLQQALVAQGYTLTVDGSFGAITERIVKVFQRAKGLTVDGIVGPKTWAALLPTVD